MKTGTVFNIGKSWRELAAFSLWFRLLESLLFAPAAALAGKWLLGRTVLDSTAVVSFLLSPRGTASLLMAAAAALSIRLFEQAGLSVIIFGAFEGRRVPAREALRLVLRHSFTLTGVALRFAAAGLLVLLPIAATAGGFAAWLLPRHDVNYYLKIKPPEFITAAAATGLVAVLSAVVAVALAVRWRWVVQVVLFERLGAGAAFGESANLTRGRRWKLAGFMGGVALLWLAPGLLASLFVGVCTQVVLSMTGGSAAVLTIAFCVLLLLRIVAGAAGSLIGACTGAGVFTYLYGECRGFPDGAALPPAAAEDGRGAVPRWVPVALTGGLLVFSATGTLLGLDAIAGEQTISIHAHRGVSHRAPENTIAAVRAAVAAGAHYVETDIQLSKDGVPVAVHDSDFSRLGGVAKKVWELTYDEIRAIPLGSRSAPEFRNEITPTFEELLAETKDKIRVNIELKYYGNHQPGLARKVVDAVRARGMLDQVVIQCLEYGPLLEVKELAPEVPTGYLLSFNARIPSRLKVDFLSVERRRLDRIFILNAHHHGQQVYAWTVNSAAEMERLFDLGVDGIITDQPALARETLGHYLDCPLPERAARRVRAWLTD